MDRTTSLTHSHYAGLAEQVERGGVSSTTRTRNVHGTSREPPQDEDGAHLAPVGEASLVVDGAEIPARHASAAGGKEAVYPNAASALHHSWMGRTQNSHRWVPCCGTGIFSVRPHHLRARAAEPPNQMQYAWAADEGETQHAAEPEKFYEEPEIEHAGVGLGGQGQVPLEAVGKVAFCATASSVQMVERE